MRQKQTGFTLIEIAIVLVIIGLLLGGVLKGQELITSARVRNLISQQDGVKAAFFGFQDRFRAFPGDYTGAVVNIANIDPASPCNGGVGNGNGRIEGGALTESVLAWEHLSKAGFITGTYTCAAAESATTTPVNPYGIYLQLIYDGAYGNGAAAPRHNVKTGAQIPVELISEMDRKIDDGNPNTGGFQFSAYQGQAAAAPTGGGGTVAPNCTSAADATGVWNTTNGEPNCGGASLL